ncbi:MAG: phage tail tape measure C-terminal domain-containing protein [Rhodocyclaceae bacterium]|nr:phage tail tape measure C-terminal domain-containing protein [Rhodocyclaceae bacterium]
MTYLESAKDLWSKFWDAAENSRGAAEGNGRTKTPEERMASAMTTIQGLRDKLTSPLYAAYKSTLQEQLAAATNEYLRAVEDAAAKGRAAIAKSDAAQARDRQNAGLDVIRKYSLSYKVQQAKAERVKLAGDGTEKNPEFIPKGANDDETLALERGKAEAIAAIDKQILDARKAAGREAYDTEKTLLDEKLKLVDDSTKAQLEAEKRNVKLGLDNEQDAATKSYDIEFNRFQQRYALLVQEYQAAQKAGDKPGAARAEGEMQKAAQDLGQAKTKEIDDTKLALDEVALSAAHADQIVGNLQATFAKQNDATLRGMEIMPESQRKLGDALAKVDEEGRKASAQLDNMYRGKRELADQYQAELQKVAVATDAQREAAIALAAVQDQLNASWEYGADVSLQKYLDQVNDVAAKSEQVMTKALRGIDDQLVNLEMTGKMSFSSLANSIIADMLRIENQANITGPLAAAMKSAGGISGILSSFFGGSSDVGSVTAMASDTADTTLSDAAMAWAGFAKGDVFNSPSLHSFVNGVYDTPKVFAFAQGGVFAEAGPEAVMPLQRGADGKLGVKAYGADPGAGAGAGSIADATLKALTDALTRQVVTGAMPAPADPVPGDWRGTGGAPSPYASAISSSPTLSRFAQAGAFGSAGGAGPVSMPMPLRDPDGKLGVQAYGADPGAGAGARSIADATLQALTDALRRQVVTGAMPAPADPVPGDWRGTGSAPSPYANAISSSPTVSRFAQEGSFISAGAAGPDGTPAPSRDADSKFGVKAYGAEPGAGAGANSIADATLKALTDALTRQVVTGAVPAPADPVPGDWRGTAAAPSPYANAISSSPTLSGFAQAGAFGSASGSGSDGTPAPSRDADGKFGVKAYGAEPGTGAGAGSIADATLKALTDALTRQVVTGAVPAPADPVSGDWRGTAGAPSPYANAISSSPTLSRFAQAGAFGSAGGSGSDGTPAPSRDADSKFGVKAYGADAGAGAGAGSIADATLKTLTDALTRQVVTGGTPSPYANAISSSPTLSGFAQAGAIGRAGEDRPDDTMSPLRGGDNKPAVQAYGAGPGAGAAPVVNVNVIGAPSTPTVQTTQTANGLDVHILFEQAEAFMGNRVARGLGLAQVMEPRYALNPAAGAGR